MCNLWVDILARITQCWTRLVFDIAENPSVFIAAFELSTRSLKDVPLKVLVFHYKETAVVISSHFLSALLLVTRTREFPLHISNLLK